MKIIAAIAVATALITFAAPLATIGADKPNCAGGTCSDCKYNAEDRSCCSECKKEGQLLACGCNQGCPCEACDLFALINAGISLIVKGLIPLVAVLMIAWSGFKMVINQGNAEIVKQCTTMMWAVAIGLVVIFAGYALVGIILHEMGYVNATNPLNWAPKCN